MANVTQSTYELKVSEGNCPLVSPMLAMAYHHWKVPPSCLSESYTVGIQLKNLIIYKLIVKACYSHKAI